MVVEYTVSIFRQHRQQNHSQYPTGNHFSRADGQAVETETLYQGHALDQQAVAVDQYERHNNRIRENRADGRTPFPFSQGISAERAEQRCQSTKNNIGQSTARHDIA